MQQLSWFKERINTTILRERTEIKVTEDNYEKLYEVQEAYLYQFKDK